MTTQVGFAFDDGFRVSAQRVADLFEAFGLRAVFAVVAVPGKSASVGDWALWNKLAERGHLIHPHGYDHSEKWKLPHEIAVRKLEECFRVFGEELEGFDPRNAVFHYPFNTGTDALHQWLLERVSGVRIGGDGFHTPAMLATRIYRAAGYGPESCDAHLRACLERCKVVRPGVFIYNLHGVDGEGWGTISYATLADVLKQLRDDPSFGFWDWGVGPANGGSLVGRNL